MGATINHEGFGDFFRRLRRSRGFKTQKQLAQESGVSQTTLSRIEDGTQIPLPDTLKILASKLNASHMDLMVLAGHWDESDLGRSVDKEKIISGEFQINEKKSLFEEIKNDLQSETNQYYLEKLKCDMEFTIRESGVSLDEEKIKKINEYAQGIFLVDLMREKKGNNQEL